MNGWDDPRMPTISGLRRRGYTPEAIRAVLRSHRRGQVQQHDRHARARRRRARRSEPARPACDGRAAAAEARDRKLSRRQSRGDGGDQQPRGSVGRHAKGALLAANCTSSRTTFARSPPKSSTALAPGAEVRLRAAYIIKCTGVAKDDKTGEIKEVRCTYDPQTEAACRMPTAR